MDSDTPLQAAGKCEKLVAAAVEVAVKAAVEEERCNVHWMLFVTSKEGVTMARFDEQPPQWVAPGLVASGGGLPAGAAMWALATIVKLGEVPAGMQRVQIFDAADEWYEKHRCHEPRARAGLICKPLVYCLD
jgi:hypothetical protein